MHRALPLLATLPISWSLAHGTGVDWGRGGAFAKKVARCAEANVSARGASGKVMDVDTEKSTRFGAAASSGIVRRAKQPKNNFALLLTFVSGVDWVLYSLAAISSMLSSLTTTYQARLIGNLFDSLGKSSNAAVSGGPTAASALRSIWSSSATGAPLSQLLGVFLAQSLLNFVSTTALAVATTNLGTRLRSRVFVKLINRDVADFDKISTGEMTGQLQNDVSALQTAVRECFTKGVEGVTSLVSGSYLLFYTSPPMATVMMTLLPASYFVGTLLGEALRAISRQTREAQNKAIGYASESLQAVRTVRSFAAEDRESKRFDAKLEEVATLKTRSAMLSGGFYAGVSLGINLMTLVVGGIGKHLIERGSLTRGDLATIMTQVQLLQRSFFRLSMLSAQVSKAAKSSEGLFELLTMRPLIDNAGGGLVLGNVRGKVVFDDVVFSYPSRPNFVVFDGLNIVAEPNQVVALVGHSGSGKSTITSLLERFYDVDEGAITIDGCDVRYLDPRWLREKVIGFVPQKSDLFSGTIRENVLFGNESASEEQLIEACRRANAHDFITSFPDGYDTVLGESGSQLSGGQRQRIAIARTLLKDPKILIFDEITSGLDSESEYLVSKSLEELMKGRTCFVVAHRLSTVVHADKIVVLEEGRVIEEGKHEELIQRASGAYRSFWEKQNRGLKRRASSLGPKRSEEVPTTTTTTTTQEK